jgi:hypothetical protein
MTRRPLAGGAAGGYSDNQQEPQLFDRAGQIEFGKRARCQCS